MACNQCETTFQGYQTLRVSIQKSGSTARLYVANQGRNIVLLRRILFCIAYQTGGATIQYLRAPPEPISWIPSSAYIETGFTALYYELTDLPAAAIVQAQAEYVEIDGRSRSCPETI